MFNFFPQIFLFFSRFRVLRTDQNLVLEFNCVFITNIKKRIPKTKPYSKRAYRATTSQCSSPEVDLAKVAYPFSQITRTRPEATRRYANSASTWWSVIRSLQIAASKTPGRTSANTGIIPNCPSCLRPVWFQFLSMKAGQR